MKYLLKMILPVFKIVWWLFLTICLIMERFWTLIRLAALFLWDFKLKNKDLSFMHEIHFVDWYFDNLKDYYQFKNYRDQPAKYYT